MTAAHASNPGPAPAVLVELASPRIAVAVCTEAAPSDAEWTDYLETLAALDDADHRTVVFTAGGGPTALQQVELQRATANLGDVKIAVVTRRSAARGVATVSRWFRPTATRAFATHELDEAFGFLELSSRERTRVMLLARRLARELQVAERFDWS